MLLTEELKNYVYNEVQTRLGEVPCGIFSLFGQDFQKRKDEEIEEILKKNPYNDI